MDAVLRDALLEKYRGGGDAIRVVDAAGLPAGHRPGYLFDRNNALADSVAEAAYRERVQRLDAKARKRRRPDDDDDRYQETERERRQRLARKAAEATMGADARQPTLDEARAAASAATGGSR
jgi:hypothetical protein